MALGLSSFSLAVQLSLSREMGQAVNESHQQPACGLGPPFQDIQIQPWLTRSTLIPYGLLIVLACEVLQRMIFARYSALRTLDSIQKHSPASSESD